MKLVRYGRAGKEKPGLIDKAGQAARPQRGRRRHRRRHARAARAGAARQDQARIAAAPSRRAAPRPLRRRRSATSSPSGSTTPITPPNRARRCRRSRFCSTRRRSCIVGPDDDIVIPEGSQKTDWEVELAIVIGDARQLRRRERRASPCRGLLHLQRRVRARVPDRARRPVDEGQGLPDLRPARALAGHRPTRSPTRRSSTCGSTSTASACRPARRRPWSSASRTLVSYISQFMILEPGDVITTGTPPGVGMGKKPPRFLKAGRHGLARHRRARPAGAARRRLPGRVSGAG